MERRGWLRAKKSAECFNDDDDDYHDDYGVVDDNDDCREVGLEEKQIEARYLLSDSGSHRI